MALIDLINENVIRVPMMARGKLEVMREMAELLRDAGKIGDVEKIIDSLMDRESKGSTGLEKGIAVPHCKTELVDGLVLAIGIAPQGIDFAALDGEPSKLFFLILAPPDQSGPHIEALAEIARLTQSDAFSAALIDSATPREVVELFAE